MENQSSDPVPPGAAQEQLGVARQAHDASVRRATTPAGFILALSAFCGAQTVAPAYKGPGNVVSIVAVAWLLSAVLVLSARYLFRGYFRLQLPGVDP